MDSVVNGNANGQNRRVLMICSGFPPSGGAGVQRSAKFAKYLPHFGWEPIVWSCGHLANLPRDDSLSEDLPEELDHRTQTNWDTSRWPVQVGEVMREAARLLGGGNGIPGGLGWRAERLVRGLIGNLVPDGQAIWALGSLGPLRGVVNREQIDVIYSTFSPASNHLLGWLLKRATRKPWVSDYRDLWTEDCWYPYANGPRWRRAADRYLEQRFLEDADVVVGVSPAQTRILAQRVPDQRDKFLTIANGVDLEDFAGIDRAAARVSAYGGNGHDGRFVLAHVGRFTRERVRPEMIEGFSQFVRRLGQRAEQFELRIVGWMPDALHERLKASGVPCTACGYLPHREAVREMVAADALLLQYPDEPNADTAISGKLFEYFAAGRPVLMIGPPSSATRKLVEEFEAGVGVDPQAGPACEALTRLWEQWSSDRLPEGCHPDRLARYTRRYVTGELAQVLESVCPIRR